MCTVTLATLPNIENGFVLTSNRDEVPTRQTLPPKIYVENGVKMLYPKDKEGGGSWIGISEPGRVICLLNGEFKDHKRNPPYRLSRGVILKELLAATHIDKAISSINLENIEPFTCIIIDYLPILRFMEFVWDGREKHVLELDEGPHIWSSSPLYTAEMKALRDEWFNDYKLKNLAGTEDFWKFHHTAGVGDKEVDVIMDRGFIMTKSITQVSNASSEVKMVYKDLQHGKIFEETFNI